MTTITTNLKFHAPATRIRIISCLSQLLSVMVRTLADFNRYMDAAQRVHDADRPR